MLHRVRPAGNLPDIEGWNVRGSPTGPSDADLRIVWTDDLGSLSILVDDGDPPTFVMCFNGIAHFTLCYATHDIIISLIEDDVPSSTIDHLLVDQVWPRILAHRGDLVLHAAGVLGPGGAILFVGESGRGKSTLAASLHQRGHPLLGDDAIVMSARDGAARCRAVYRSLRLFPDSITSLFDQPVRRSQVADYTDKENIHLTVSEASGDDHRVKATFFIDPDGGSERACVEALSPGDACMRMVEHSFWLDPTDMARTARKLASASALANAVPAYKLAYPRDYRKLDELHAAIFSVLEPSGRSPDNQGADHW